MAIPSAPQRPGRRLDFRDHRRELHDNVYVYAVVSRRSQGLSIGINLNADKVCNFDCPYCQVDRSVQAAHGRDVDIAVLEAELDDLLSRVAHGSLWTLSPFDTAAPALRRVNDVAFAGDGEPTACPQFPQAVEVVGRLRDKHGLDGLKVHLLTNATLLDRPRVQRGLQALDAVGGIKDETLALEMYFSAAWLCDQRLEMPEDAKAYAKKAKDVCPANDQRRLEFLDQILNG